MLKIAEEEASQFGLGQIEKRIPFLEVFYNLFINELERKDCYLVGKAVKGDQKNT